MDGISTVDATAEIKEKGHDLLPGFGTLIDVGRL
jgi:hypothetical protein